MRSVSFRLIRAAVVLGCGLLLAFGPPCAADEALAAGVAAYERGDYGAALAEFRPLAEAGNAQAQYYLGYMHETGKGLPTDPVAAARWYLPAAEQGVVGAQFNLGLAYLEGRGVENDDAQALAWLRLAADQGHTRSQYKVAEMFEAGRGTRRDFVQAHLWFALAGRERYADARKRKRKVADRMTPYEIAEAEMLARLWKQAHKGD